MELAMPASNPSSLASGRSCAVRRPEGGLCDERPDLGDVLCDRGPCAARNHAEQRLHHPSRLERPSRRTPLLLLDQPPHTAEATLAEWLCLPLAGRQLRRAGAGPVCRSHCPRPPVGEPGAGRPVRTSSSLSGRLSLSRANSRPPRRTVGRVRPSCDDGRPVARLSGSQAWAAAAGLSWLFHARRQAHQELQREDSQVAERITLRPTAARAIEAGDRGSRSPRASRACRASCKTTRTRLSRRP